MILLVGLGNPTPDSNDNRHNVGFKIIDSINRKFGLTKQKPKFKGLLTTGNISNKKIYAINNSNGNYLWSYKLPATGSALPLIHDNSSERWIFVVTGGRRSPSYRGNNIVAFKQKLN